LWIAPDFVIATGKARIVANIVPVGHYREFIGIVIKWQTAEGIRTLVTVPQSEGMADLVHKAFIISITSEYWIIVSSPISVPRVAEFFASIGIIARKITKRGSNILFRHRET
jgi:hypothetical protein